jgi:hypothetical protein
MQVEGDTLLWTRTVRLILWEQGDRSAASSGNAIAGRVRRRHGVLLLAIEMGIV